MTFAKNLKSQTPHVAFFGCTNSGKSSLINLLTNQNLSIVSDKKGTTTDPVQKTVEVLPIGPLVLIDTAGIDDKTELGTLRIQKTKEILNKTDLAILVIDSNIGKTNDDEYLIKLFKEKNIDFIEVHNKSDLHKTNDEKILYTSAKTGFGLENLKEKIKEKLQKNKKEKFIIADKITTGDIIILVIPIDSSAPKGRIILPQQLVLREILDKNAIAICTQPNELKKVLEKISPKMIITDSQVFGEIKDIVPTNTLLTSFSILMAKYKGEIKELIKNIKQLENLKDNDTILISEGCTHHRQCNDIGTVKIPNLIKKNNPKINLNFEFTQGGDFPEDLSKYALIVHCGGCMLNETEMNSRIQKAKNQNKAMINYGALFALTNGVLERSLEIFPELKGDNE